MRLLTTELMSLAKFRIQNLIYYFSIICGSENILVLVMKQYMKLELYNISDEDYLMRI